MDDKAEVNVTKCTFKYLNKMKTCMVAACSNFTVD